MANKFVWDHERLLLWNQNGEHITIDKTIDTAEDAVLFADDQTVRIFRFDTQIWNFEDVTEDIAEAWIGSYAEHPDDLNVRDMGPWLEDSVALQDYIDGYDHAARSDFDEHNTLNRAQQGG